MANPRPDDVRLRLPDRSQVVMSMQSPDDLLDADHPVRVVWRVVCALDLGRFYEPIRSRDGEPGRDATDPRLLVALWLWAATDGVGSARELARLCTESKPYAWLCGGVSVNHHTLSDFRVGHAAALDDLLTQVIASLVERKLVDVHRISQDGVRVRACAGAGSFRRKDRSNLLLAQARAHVAELRGLLDDPARGAGLSAKRRAAMERAAREREERVAAAIAQLPALEARQAKLAKRVSAGQKAKGKLKEPRVSTTDPRVRVMKMPDGGFRPAVNVQLAAATSGRAIVGVEVVPDGVDTGQLEPMRRQVETRAGRKVGEHLADGGFLRHEGVDGAAEAGVSLYVPPKPPRDPARYGSEYEPRPDDTEAVRRWRHAMGTAEAKAIYKGACGDERDDQRGPADVPRARATDRARAAQGPVRRAVVRVGVQPHALRDAPGRMTRKGSATPRRDATALHAFSRLTRARARGRERHGKSSQALSAAALASPHGHPERSRTRLPTRSS